MFQTFTVTISDAKVINHLIDLGERFYFKLDYIPKFTESLVRF